MDRIFSIKINHIRAFGACWIFVFHFYHFELHPYFDPIDTINPLELLVYHGYWAVNLFFLLSGFLLARINFGKQLLVHQFVGKRLIRLLPAYFLCLFIYFITNNQSAEAGWIWMTWLSDIRNYPQQIGHLWFINRLVVCYSFFPLIWVVDRFGGRHWLAFGLSVSVLISLLDGIQSQLNPANYYGSLHLCLNQFVLGCLLAKCWLQEPQSTQRFHTLVIITLWLLMLVFYHQSIWREPLAFTVIELFWLNALGVFIAYLLCEYLSHSFKPNGLMSRFFCYFGEISYSFYLFHFLVIHFFLAHPTWLSLNPWFNGLFLFMISFLIAMISYYLAERAIQFFIIKLFAKSGLHVSH